MPLGVGVARYGTLAGNAMDSLLRRMNALYMPTFLGNKQWPESFKKEFSGKHAALSLLLSLLSSPFLLCVRARVAWSSARY